MGVDLLPAASGGYTVLQLTGAVEFTSEYALGGDPFVAAAGELARIAESGRVPVEALPLAVALERLSIPPR